MKIFKGILFAGLLSFNLTIYGNASFLPQDEPSKSSSLPFNKRFSPSQESLSHAQDVDVSLLGPWGLGNHEAEIAFEKNSYLVCLIEFGSYFRKVNTKWSEVLGWDTRELLTTPYYEFIHPDDLEKTRNYEENFIPTGFINRYRCKDGSYRHLSWIGLTHLGGDKKHPSFGIAMDVTFDMILKEEDERKVQLLNEHINFQSRIIQSIAQLQRIYLGELGCYGDESDPRLSLSHIIQHFVTLSGSKFGFIGQLVQDGHQKYLMHKTWEPNTLLNKSEKELYERCKQLDKGLTNFNSLVKATLKNDKLLMINNIEDHFKTLGPYESSPEFKCFLGVPLYSRHEMVGILALANREHGYNEQLVTWFEPLFILAGRILNETNLLHFRQDAFKQQVAKEKAEAKTKAKSKFLAHMSHELRTPISGIIGLLDLIDEGQLNKEHTSYLQTARDTSSSLLNIVNDILDLSKIEEAKLVLEEIPFSPMQVAQDVVKILSFSANKKNIKLKMINDVNMPSVLIGDPTRMRQIFMNLVGNAIKFTEKGSIKVSLGGEIFDTEAEGQTFILRGKVKDTGIGISVDKQQHLFEAFTQADSSMTRRFGGTGLGLYITQHLCKIMGGQVNVKSQEGKGATFTFTAHFPIPQEQISPGKKSRIKRSPSLPPLRILIAEDNVTNQLLLKVMLERSGSFVTVVNNGREAIEEFQKAPYELILMDGQMPEMDGLDATRAVRQLSQKQVPIIGITAHAMSTDRDRFMEAGMNGYLTKPINKKALYKEILRCLKDKIVKKEG